MSRTDWTCVWLWYCNGIAMPDTNSAVVHNRMLAQYDMAELSSTLVVSSWLPGWADPRRAVLSRLHRSVHHDTPSTLSGPIIRSSKVEFLRGYLFELFSVAHHSHGWTRSGLVLA